MTSFKSILVPIDFSDASSAAVDLAAELTQAFGAELTLLHVWELPIYPYAELMLSAGDIATALEKAAEQRLAEALTSLKTRVPGAKSLLKMGVAWQQIIDAVKEQHPDLVVMGTHGRHGLSHAMLGSVAEKVVRLSPVPVLTTRAATPIKT